MSSAARRADAVKSPCGTGPIQTQAAPAVMVTGAPVSGSSSPPSHLAGLARRVAYSLDAVTVRVSNKDGEIGRVVLTEQPRNLQHLGPQPLGGTLELAYLLTR